MLREEELRSFYGQLFEKLSVSISQKESSLKGKMTVCPVCRRRVIKLSYGRVVEGKLMGTIANLPLRRSASAGVHAFHGSGVAGCNF
jgi:hypothetical protein